MKLSLPEEAKKFYNERAQEFLLKLAPASKSHSKPKAISSFAHRPSSTIHEEDIISGGVSGRIDGFGKHHAIYFQTDNGPVGLADNEYREFEEFVLNFANKKQIVEILSIDFVKDVLLKWFEKCYKGELTDRKHFLSYLELEAKKAIKTQKISIPISFLAIQSTFKIGNVTFEYYPEGFFDSFENELLKIHPKEEKKMLQWMEKMRKDYQGIVFSTMYITAEEKKAQEIAVNETENALIVLRFFSPTALLPEIRSYFGKMGHTNVPTNHFFIFEDKFPNLVKEIAEDQEFIWTIRDQDFKMFRQIGLDRISELISKKEKSSFEDSLFNSVKLFSRAITSKEFQDKLVFTLVSLENLFLKDTSEPIQFMLGLRLAFRPKLNSQQRKDIMRLIKDSYKLRSSYIHHGKMTDNYKLLRNLQRISWDSFRIIINNKDKFTKREDLLNFIEDRILS